MVLKLQRLNLLNVLIIVQVTLVRCEDSVFRIRKCCAEDEFFDHNIDECVKNDIKMDINYYHHENEEVSNVTTDRKNFRPWWFPPYTKIFSKKTNEVLKEFPSKIEVIDGEGQPCGFWETIYIYVLWSQYDFFEDGSILLYPNHTNGMHTHKTEITFDPLSFCVDKFDLGIDTSAEATQPTLNFAETSHHYVLMLCPCTKATCILKCCPTGMVMDVDDMEGERTCTKKPPGKQDWVPNYAKLDNDSRDYFVLQGQFPHCKENEHTVIPNQMKKDGHTIYSNGSARIYEETRVSQPLEFCGENFVSRPEDGSKVYNHIIRCYPEAGVINGDIKIRNTLYGILFVFGAFFLFLTLLVHGLISTKNNIHDKNLISQTWSLFIGYMCVAISQLGNDILPQKVCILLGFLIQYSFLAAFFWLNVLCFDISWTFSELRIVRGIPNERNRTKFFYYSIYCWLFSAAISLVTAIVEFSPNIPDSTLKPHIIETCWFKYDSAAILAYFYGPIAVLLSINVLLFTYTSFRIYHAQNDISAVIRNTKPEKQRFILYVKLLVLMGLPWTAEFVSWIVGGPYYYWYLTDVINLLRAVFIFAVFCCKKQVLDELKRRFGSGREIHIRTPSIPGTSFSFYATTNSQELPKCTNNAVSSL